MPDDLGMLPGYDIQNIEVRPDMIVISFSDPEKAKQPFPDHTTRVFQAGRDPEVDGKVRELLDDAQQLLDLAHIANRMPPETRRAGPPPVD